MEKDKMYVINKLFNNEEIRTVWDKEEEKYYISVVDVVSALTESKDGRKYWNKLKLKAKDDKYYNTDVCDIDETKQIENK